MEMGRLKGGFQTAKGHLPFVGILALLTIVYFIQFFNYQLPGRDMALAHAPIFETLRISYFQYGDLWPLWDPYSFGGDPFLMKNVYGFDSIPGLLVFALDDSILALKLSYVFLFFLAGIFMYALAVSLGLERRYAFVAALVFMLNAHVIKLLKWGWITSLGGYALLPLVILFGRKAIKDERWATPSILTGIIFAIMLRFGPDMKVGLWAGLMFGIFLIFNLIIGFSTKKLARYTLVAVVVLLVFFGLSLQRIIPQIDSLNLGARSQTTWEQASSRHLPASQFWSRLVEPIRIPRIQAQGSGDHIGIIAFLLAGYGIWKLRRNKMVLFFGLLGILSVLLANNTLGIYYALWHLPLFKSMRYLDRSLFLFVMAGSGLAAYGAREFFSFEKLQKKSRWMFPVFVVVLLLNIWVFNFYHYSPNIRDWSDGKKVIAENNVLQFVSKQSGNFRIQTWETRGIDWGTNLWNAFLQLEHIYSYNSIWHPLYMNVYLDVANVNPAKLWGMLNVKYITATQPLNVSGFRFVQEFPPCETCFPDKPQIQKAWGPFLYENEYFLPRAYIVPNAILLIGGFEQVLSTNYNILRHPSFNPTKMALVWGKERLTDYSLKELLGFSAVIIADGTPTPEAVGLQKAYGEKGGKILPDLASGKNSITEQEIVELFSSFSEAGVPLPDDSIAMHDFDTREITSLQGRNGYLVYSEKFALYPGWNAVNERGEKVGMELANGVNTVVPLDGTFDTLRFTYEPRGFKEGSWLAIATIALLLVYFSFRWVRKKRMAAHSRAETEEKPQV